MSLSARAPARPIRVVFLDDGGVLNDNERRAPEWRRLLGEFFAPRFGGTPLAWGEANTVVYGAIWEDWHRARATGADPEPDWFPKQDERWLRGMFAHVGVPVPADVHRTVRASRAHVMEHIDCAFPEAAAAVRALRGAA
jgi:hypothetical protein